MYFLDEPEAALSPQRQLTLLMEVYKYAKEGAQFFIVTHSPILLGIPDVEIYCFDNGCIHLCSYEETESYQVANGQENTAMLISYEEQQLRWAKKYLLDGSPVEIEIAGTVSECPFNTENGDIMICSEDTFRQLTGEENYTVIDIQLTKRATDADVDALRGLTGTKYTFSDLPLG